MTDEERKALEAACERAEHEYPLLAAPDGTVAVNFKHLRAALDQIEADGQRIAELEAALGKREALQDLAAIIGGEHD